MMTDIKEKQIWAIPAEDGLPPLFIYVHQLDSTNHGVVASVSIEPHPDAAQAGWPAVSHSPIDVETLQISHGQLVSAEVEPTEDFENGYQLWKKEFVAGNAGFFTMSAAETYGAILGVVEQAKSTEEVK